MYVRIYPHQAPAQGVFPNPLPLAVPSTVVQAQDFNETVVPITKLKLLGPAIGVNFGTGFCLDRQCRFIGTNYHVAMMARPHKIKGQKVIHRYLATGPNDEDATVNDGPSMGPMKYTLSRDLAIFELRHPLPHHRGLAFSLDDLEVGQEVDIYAYPKESINPIRRLLQFHGTFKGQTITGLLAFDYSLSADKAIRPGASGGIVVDSKTQQIVGILNAIAMNGEAIAFAVPVQSLADFVSKVQPCLAQNIFPPPRESPQFRPTSIRNSCRRLQSTHYSTDPRNPPKSRCYGARLNFLPIAYATSSRCRLLPGDRGTGHQLQRRRMRSESLTATNDSANTPMARKSYKTYIYLL